MRLDRMTGVLVLATGVVLNGVAAAAPAPTPAPEPAETHGAPPSRVKPQPQTKSDEPGSQHGILGGFVGHWGVTTHILPSSATSTAQDTKGTAEGKMLLDGRFAQLTQTGILDGKPYEAVMLFGFDDVIARYTATWMDTTSPAFIGYVGTYDAAKKQITMEAHYSEQAMRRFTVSRVVVTFVDNDSIVLEEYISHAVNGSAVQTKTVTLKRG